MPEAVSQLEGSWWMNWENLNQASDSGDEGKETLFKD